MKRVLVTGASGFLGGSIARSLAAQGHEIIAPCRAPSRAQKDLTSDRLQVCEADGTGFRPLLHEEAPPLDAVIHFAVDYGRDDVPASRVAASNVVSSIKLLEWTIDQGAGLFINADTCFTPDYPYLRTYTLSKKQFVAWGEVISKGSNTKFANLVLQHPFGPGDRAGKFVPWLINRCLRESGPIDLTEGDQEKDFIYVDDVAAACSTLLENADSLPQGASHYPIGRGECVTLRQFIELVHDACNSKATLNFGALPKREGEARTSVADISRMRNLGWRPATPLEEAVRLTVNAYRAANATQGVGS